jgi:hypothetical protein
MSSTRHWVAGLVIVSVQRFILEDDTTPEERADVLAALRRTAGDDVILPRVARMSAVRFSDDDDPDIGAKVFAVYQAKVAKYPEWGRLVDSIAVE